MAAPPSQKFNKKRSADESAGQPSKKAKGSKPAASTKPAAAAPVSSLVAEEVDFPRGGGSTLTPLEFKEATNEARLQADADVRVEVRPTRLTPPLGSLPSGTALSCFGWLRTRLRLSRRRR